MDQLINWIPIKEAAQAGLPAEQQVLVTDGAGIAIWPFGDLLRGLRIGASLLIYWAVVTLPNGQPAKEQA